LKLHCIASGSKGNCHFLEDEGGDILILDAGCSLKELKIGLRFYWTNVVGVCVTHEHLDHSRCADILKEIGLNVWEPYKEEGILRKPRKFGEFTVYPLPMMDKTFSVWQHSNSDRTQCKCYGYYILHPDMGSLLYFTDIKCIVWNFRNRNIENVLISVNYDKEYEFDGIIKRNHVLTGHLSLQEACHWLSENQTPFLRNVIACHLSDSSCDREKVRRSIQDNVSCNVNIAEPGLEVDLSEVPF
jgi:hypothetical protein